MPVSSSPAPDVVDHPVPRPEVEDAATPKWHALRADDVAAAWDVDPASGLPAGEVARRRARYGPNRLREQPRRSAWATFADQFRNLLTAVLAGAAVVAGLVGDLKDTVVIAVVLLFNGVLGFLQEHRAEATLDALRRMVVPSARVRREGQVSVIPAEELVPGDVVLVEAGDRIPADGRLVAAHSLEIDESALTGESVPVEGAIEPVPAEAPLAERSSMVHLNCTVTRGRGELVVTATGPHTEIGRVAELIGGVESAPTPLQEQLAGLGKRLALLAGAAVAVFFTLGLLRGSSLADTLLDSVALAVAAIPEGLPAVVTVTLAIGVQQLAKRGAIVKRLSSVETLGSATVICSDKTGTLTQNRMTAREVVVAGRRTAVSDLAGVAEEGERRLVEAAVLCNDSHLVDGELVGDPTEGALLHLAPEIGIDPDELRAATPRVAEVPFDSARKFMVTLHRDGDDLRVCAKGAADVLAARCRVSDDEAAELRSATDAMAATGLRVLAVAEGRLPVSGDLPTDADALLAVVGDLEIVGLVGLLDPPRPEARHAIATCHRAGIDVKMITGDHATTASAIAAELGIRGTTLSGAELDRLDDDELREAVRSTGVFARVAPDHKIRIVRALQANGEVVAMTGDGVNDAPALRGADIGVAMGITGTEVSKEAADVVLTDDDFSTIVAAVRGGRSIYANIVTFVRFQLSTNLGAILSLLGARISGLPVPFSAIQVLWVNIIMDGPPALALGMEPPASDVMDHPPRGRRARILTGRRLGVLLSSGAVMAAGTLGVLAWAQEARTEAVALTLAFTTFVLFQVGNALNARDERRSVFRRDTLRNVRLWAALALVVSLQVAAISVPALRGVMGVAPLSLGDWALAVAIASSVIWVEEVRKLVLRRREGRPMS